eukprot:3118895-Pyramimonas_sp.AAC.1
MALFPPLTSHSQRRAAFLLRTTLTTRALADPLQRENHNSVLGIREYAVDHGSSFNALKEGEVEQWLAMDDAPFPAPAEVEGSPQWWATKEGGVEDYDPAEDADGPDHYSLFAFPVTICRKEVTERLSPGTNVCFLYYRLPRCLPVRVQNGLAPTSPLGNPNEKSFQSGGQLLGSEVPAGVDQEDSEPREGAQQPPSHRLEGDFSGPLLPVPPSRPPPDPL